MRNDVSEGAGQMAQGTERRVRTVHSMDHASPTTYHVRHVTSEGIVRVPGAVDRGSYRAVREDAFAWLRSGGATARIYDNKGAYVVCVSARAPMNIGHRGLR